MQKNIHVWVVIIILCFYSFEMRACEAKELRTVSSKTLCAPLIKPSQKCSMQHLVQRSGALISNSIHFYLQHYKTISLCLISTGALVYISQQLINSWALKNLKKEIKKVKQEIREIDIQEQEEAAAIQKFLHKEYEENQEHIEKLTLLLGTLNNFFDTHAERSDDIMLQIAKHQEKIRSLCMPYKLSHEKNVQEEKESTDQDLNADTLMQELQGLSEENNQLYQKLLALGSLLTVNQEES